MPPSGNLADGRRRIGMISVSDGRRADLDGRFEQSETGWLHAVSRQRGNHAWRERLHMARPYGASVRLRPGGPPVPRPPAQAPGGRAAHRLDLAEFELHGPPFLRPAGAHAE